MAAGNHFMTVNEATKQTGISPGLLYNWIKEEKVPSKTAGDGVLRVSLDAVKAYREERGTRPKRRKNIAAKLSKSRPATKQADALTREAAVLEIYYPVGIPVDQYSNALLFLKALQAVQP